MKKTVLFMLMVFVMVFAMAMPVSAAVDFYQLGDITPQEPAGTTLFSITPAADAEFAGGSGTEDNPYLIADKYQLNNVRNHLDAHFKMTADIEFTEADFAEGGAFYNNGAGWKPIGVDEEYAFA
ncbi:MAG: hypothetical protein IJO94_03630, partial [Firmicutes bacterium]|nr:hypothetical protein [Bacillota bacterium]